MRQDSLDPIERGRGQRSALLSALFARTIVFIVSGAMMTLYANDVLGFSPARIGVILGLAPLFGLVRLAVAPLLRGISYRRVMAASTVVRLALVVLLIALPAAHLTFWLYAAIIITFHVAQQVGLGVVWQPALREYTTNGDRGRFFARMRFSFATVTAVATIAIATLIGANITETQYKVLLAFAAAGAANQLFWILRMPPVPQPVVRDVRASIDHLKLAVRESAVLRRPLVLALMLNLCIVPVFLVYLRQLHHIPSNWLSLYALMLTAGQAISFIIWGRLADAIGFRPMLIGVMWLGIAVGPLLLFLAPLAPTVSNWSDLDNRGLLTMTALFVYGVLMGALLAGEGIATTTIQHFHVRRRHAYEAMNIYAATVVVSQSIVAIAGGLWVENVVLPAGSQPWLDGLIHTDWLKAYLLLVVPALRLLVIWHARKLPNAKPYYGVTDFFSSLLSSPVRTIYAHRQRYHEDAEKRRELARWAGGNLNPLSYDPLIEITCAGHWASWRLPQPCPSCGVGCPQSIRRVCAPWPHGRWARSAMSRPPPTSYAC
jgi:MFS family permease